MATHSSILIWRTPWTEEPGGLQSMGLQESDTTEQLTLTQALTHPFIQLVSTKGNFTICVLATAASSSFFLLLSLVSRSVSQNVFWGALVFKTVYELKVKQIWGTPLLAHLHVKD